MPNSSGPESPHQRALTVFAKAHSDTPGLVLGREAGLASALASALGVQVAPATAGTEAELAHAATDLLLSDQEYAPQLRALLTGPAPEQFGMIETTAVISAALLVLQTHVRIERKSDGRWSVLVTKKPTDTALLTKLVTKLLPFLDKP